MIARDVTCTFPGCRTPARRCDLDHIKAFDHRRPGDAQTTYENLHSLCRHHHLLKTYAGWTVTRDPTTARTDWTAPTGHRYTRPSTDFNPDPPLPTAPPPDYGDPPF